MKHFAVLAFAGLALAAPYQKRDVVYETVLEEVYETVYTTTTVWVDPASATSTSATGTPSVAVFAQEQRSLSSVSTSVAPVVAYVPSSTSAATAPAAVVPSSAPSVAQPAPTTSVAPAAAPAPVASSPAPVYSAPTASSAPAATSSASSGKGDHTGDITYYDVSVGTGSCGTTASNSDNVVALSHLDMNNGANPNNNPLCGKTITIYGTDGSAHQARVFDTCPTCAQGSLDLTQELFNAVAPSGDGRVHGITWSFT